MKSIYPKLSGRIKEKCGNQYRLADVMDISNTQMTKLLSGKANWNQRTILSACDILDIGINEIPAYFFEPLTIKR